MADWDSVDLLARWKRVIKRPTADEDTPDPEGYQYLAEAQATIMRIVATHAPWSQITREFLTTADGGFTYTFSSYPMGHAELKHGRNGEILYVGYDGDPRADFVAEGQTLRVPEGKSRTFANGVWASYVPIPGTLDATTQPVLKPPSDRLVIVYQAAADWAMSGNMRDPSVYLSKVQSLLFGDVHNPGDVGIIGRFKTQYHPSQIGATGVPGSDGVWYQGNPDLL